MSMKKLIFCNTIDVIKIGQSERKRAKERRKETEKPEKNININSSYK